ncbi:hypothetical protein Rhe02_25780 [Rhizocola hellebori]|uniref:Uncharacterized protein n=1 Tax=Rhizocola hellebori TaxID=1392758 RepID=A0A8J3VFW4_9ACTN|nr:hypothetical protein [Rhizocola hellebori]GIH04511.1 hypothetical protein Rhe02_25780 [Rhizocola hellebori]
MIPRRTLANGTLLGVALLSALTLAGVLGARDTPRPAAAAPSPAPPEPNTRFATQPELQQALLKVEDLPTPYASASKATVHRVAPTTERCAGLLDPGALLREAAARVLSHPEATDQATSEIGGPAPLTQLLTTFAGDGAQQTMLELRRMGNGCRDFSTTVDGAPVRVMATVVRDDTTTYSLKLTLTGSGRTSAGYLTLGRVGQVISVLKQVGPVEAIAAIDPIKLVDLTLSRLTRGR